MGTPERRNPPAVEIGAARIEAPSRRFGRFGWRRLAATYILFCMAVLTAYGVAAAESDFRVLPPTGSPARAAVLFVPGCSGFVPNNGASHYAERAAELQAAGYIVVFVDYVGRRMQFNCGHISLSEVATDILEAAASVRDGSGIDASRISVIGWSYGGGGVLAALKAMPPDRLIAKAVLYYPVCRGAASWPATVEGLMLLGGKDDIANPKLCEAVANGDAADRLRVITYPEAHHGFDVRLSSELANPPPGAPVYNAEAAKLSWAVVMDFLRK